MYLFLMKLTQAEWCSDARHKSTEFILDNYINVALDMMKTSSLYTHQTRSKVLHVFARFCDTQQTYFSKHEDLERLSQLQSRSMKEIKQLKQLAKTGDSRARLQATHHLERAKKIYDSEDKERKRIADSIQTFLEQSATNYLLSISEADLFKEDVSRFFSLWLENANNAGLNRAIASQLKLVPSYKLAPWINQLSSMLLEGETQFQKNLRILVVRICQDHPYHGLYQLLGLRIVIKDDEQEDSQALARCEAGNRLWGHLLKKGRIAVDLLNGLESFSEHAVGLAHYKVLPDKKKNFSFDLVPDRSWWMKTLPDIKVAPPTLDIPLRADCDYSNVSVIHRVDRAISIASGLSQPKIIKCLSTDGKWSTLLVKGGKDDLRQDSIMEQVFEQVNGFFKANSETRSRNLKIRTYKVIPLGPNAGIIEFVKNTVPLIDYLQPAHKKYRPKDLDLSGARENMKKHQEGSTKEKQKVFSQLMTRIKPVLRHFFFDNFFNVDDWLKNRINYTRSTAAISMVGFILGLGDRHCNNILLDTLTGEAVHIDLGIAFDQGKLLRVPETVPFRLTRDIVDGMGIAGTEGVFRKCCELTMKVLRQQSESILMILNVLRYDPLYSWTISPLKRKQLDLEMDEASNRNDEAERALSMVNKKLTPNLSVEALVSQLIQEASDEANLACLFYGWCPFY